MKFKKLLIMAITIILIFSNLLQLTEPVHAATYTDPYFKTLANYINIYGVDSEEGKSYVLKQRYDDLDYYFTIKNQSDGILFQVVTISNESDRIVGTLGFVLNESTNYILVDNIVLAYLDDELFDGADFTKSIDKKTYTVDMVYPIYDKSFYGYISDDFISTYFHKMLSLLCQVWDLKIYTELGFGMKALGFTSYDGLGDVGCTSHIYDNSCDKTCNNCGATRTISHKYSSWIKKDNTYHKRTCTVCGAAENKNHSWNAGKITKQPTCAQTGIKTYTCTVCSGTKTETIAKTTTHTYGSASMVNSTTHTRSCTVCGNVKSESHNWNSGKITKQPTCDSTGIKTYTCTVCSGTKTETIAKTTTHKYGYGTKINNELHLQNCEICGKEIRLSHTWDVGIIIVESTFDSTGIREHVCTGCEAVKTEVIPKLASGDLNGDSEVNNKDVEYLLWHTLFPEKYPLEIFADYDLNGSVNNKDVEYLLWHTLFPEKYPLYKK